MTSNHPPTGLSDHQLDELIGQCDYTPPTPDNAFVDRLRATLLDETQAEHATTPARANSRRQFSKVLVTCGIAAALLIAFMMQSPSSWAQVQEALQSRAWIRFRAKLDNGSVQENWLSIPQQKSAFRDGPIAQYVDMRSDLQFDYEESRGSIVRAPLRADSGSASIFALFEQLMLGKNPNVDQVDHAKVVDTRSRTVSENGKQWLDIELTLQRGTSELDNKRLERLEFRVDPTIKLPQTMTISILDGGPGLPADAQRKIVFEMDYPEQGPNDIYALGIPRDTKLDDRVPSDDANRALKALAAGRNDFDSYCAIVFHPAKPDQPFNALWPARVVWRRGNQVRVEKCFPVEDWSPYSEKPEGISDLAWWKEQLDKHFRLGPSVVCDGKASYRAEYAGTIEKGQYRISAWKPLASMEKGEFLRSHHLGPESHVLPEFFAYPDVGAGPTTTVQLEPAVTPELPRGSLLTYALTKPQRQAYHRTRYWLDGDRGYAATRMVIDQLEGPNGQGNGLSAVQSNGTGYTVEDQYSMQNFQRSPKGFWYPTLVIRESRTVDPKKPESEPKVETFSTSFLIDFDAEMSDSFFTAKDRQEH